MADFATVTLSDGTEVVFQTAGSREREDGSSTLSTQSISMDQLRSIATAVNEVSQMFRDGQLPQEITLEVGVGLSQEVGWFFAKSKVDSSMTVSVKWNAASTSRTKLEPRT